MIPQQLQMARSVAIATSASGSSSKATNLCALYIVRKRTESTTTHGIPCLQKLALAHCWWKRTAMFQGFAAQCALSTTHATINGSLMHQLVDELASPGGSDAK
eukprot:6177640-Pleurochrysis_carterae.AAC.4